MLAAAAAAHWQLQLPSMSTSLIQDEEHSRGDSNRDSTHSGSSGDSMGGKGNSSSSGAKATHSSGSPGLRRRAAVEARLERKRLLQTGIEALQRSCGWQPDLHDS